MNSVAQNPGVAGIDTSRYASLVAGIEALDREHASAASAFAVDIHRTCTVDQLVPYLKYELYALGQVPQVTMGEYDAIPAELMATTGLGGRRPRLAVVVLNPEMILSFAKNGQIDEALSLARLDGVLDLAMRCPYLVIVTSLAAPADLTWPAASGISATLARLNQHLSQAVATAKNLHMIDMAGLVAQLGEAECFDRRNWFRFKAPYRPALLAAMARQIGSVARDICGLAKKCLVLDCDDTLWGGIVGEVGPNGIALDPHNYPGNTFYTFQQSVLQLHRNGVMIALLSKNNEADVLEVLDNHPHCLLRRDMLVGWGINWENKPDNLRALVADLNIGLDSIVYIDDSSMECALMQQCIPEVLTLQVPADRSLQPGMLMQHPVFATRKATDEDMKRATLYREQGERSRAERSFGSLDDFLSSLDLEARIGPVQPNQMQRTAQLFSRTNQFMLTGLRPGEAELGAMIASGEYGCYVLSVRDKFGDLGLIGALLLHRDGNALRAESYALSCRALGRQLEALFFAQAVTDMAASGGETQRILALFKPSAKNAQVADLYKRFGMGEGIPQPDGTQMFEIPLQQLSIPLPSFIKVLPNG